MILDAHLSILNNYWRAAETLFNHEAKQVHGRKYPDAAYCRDLDTPRLRELRLAMHEHGDRWREAYHLIVAQQRATPHFF